MNMSLKSGSRGGRSVLLIAGWLLMVGIGVALLWVGFFRPQGDGGEEVAAEGTATLLALPVTPLGPTAAPQMASPTAMVLPTATLPPPTAAPVVPNMVAGTDGVNVRGGPGTNYDKLGYIDPGGQVRHRPGLGLRAAGDGQQHGEHTGSPAGAASDLAAATDIPPRPDRCSDRGASHGDPGAHARCPRDGGPFVHREGSSWPLWGQ